MVVTYCRLGLYIDPKQVVERLPADREVSIELIQRKNVEF